MPPDLPEWEQPDPRQSRLASPSTPVRYRRIVGIGAILAGSLLGAIVGAFAMMGGAVVGGVSGGGPGDLQLVLPFVVGLLAGGLIYMIAALISGAVMRSAAGVVLAATISTGVVSFIGAVLFYFVLLQAR